MTVLSLNEALTVSSSNDLENEVQTLVVLHTSLVSEEDNRFYLTTGWRFQESYQPIKVGVIATPYDLDNNDVEVVALTIGK